MRISPQRADNDPTRETRTLVDSAGHRATMVPPPISRRLRSIVRKRGSSSTPPTAGGPTTRWQRSRPIGCSRWGDRDMPRRGTPLLHHHGVVVRRVAMSVFESCGKQTEKPRRTPPSKLQPTIGHDQFAKNVPKHGWSCPPYANLSERLGDVDLTQHYACARPKATTQIQDAPDNISQHTTQLYGGGLREIRVIVDATKVHLSIICIISCLG